MLSLKTQRHRLEVQGYLGLSDSDVREVAPWLRFTPWMNATILAIGTILGSYRILGAEAILMALGAVLPLHPFDWVYNVAIRRFTRTRPLPPSGQQRRFVFGIMCWWLLPTAYFFYLGKHTVPPNPKYFSWAFVSGCVLIALPLLLAMSDLCAVSELLNWLSRKRDKSPKA